MLNIDGLIDISAGLSAGVFEDEETNVRESGVCGARLTAIAEHLDSLEMEATMAGKPSVVDQYVGAPRGRVSRVLFLSR